ncbi:hypothetical protein JL722_13372 [Aureococcus anophagefferens]|nr:hypothetical protein JL722_13372 [Aureococcus anophagefferens]
MPSEEKDEAKDESKDCDAIEEETPAPAPPPTDCTIVVAGLADDVKLSKAAAWEGAFHYVGGDRELEALATEELGRAPAPPDNKALDASTHARYLEMLNATGHQFVFLDVQFNANTQNNKPRKVVLELYNQLCPKTCFNFRAHDGRARQARRSATARRSSSSTTAARPSTASSPGLGPVGRHLRRQRRLREDRRDAADGNAVKFDAPGVLAMANDGAHTNNTQFFITLNALDWLDKTAVAFGRVVKGMATIRQIGALPTKNERPEIIEIDDDVAILGVEKCKLPARGDCPKHKFQVGSLSVCAGHCAQCYCYVCDAPAGDCKSWGAHCVAHAGSSFGRAKAKKKKAKQANGKQNGALQSKCGCDQCAVLAEWLGASSRRRALRAGALVAKVGAKIKPRRNASDVVARGVVTIAFYVGPEGFKLPAVEQVGRGKVRQSRQKRVDILAVARALRAADVAKHATGRFRDDDDEALDWVAPAPADGGGSWRSSAPSSPRARRAGGSVGGFLGDLENRATRSEAEPAGLSVRLLPFQRQSVRWMLDQERLPGGANAHVWAPLAPGLLYSPAEHVQAPGGGSARAGGLLCEEMGMGKTVITAALVLANPAPADRDSQQWADAWASRRRAARRWRAARSSSAPCRSWASTPANGSLADLAGQFKFVGVDALSDHASLENVLVRPLQAAGSLDNYEPGYPAGPVSLLRRLVMRHAKAMTYASSARELLELPPIAENVVDVVFSAESGRPTRRWSSRPSPRPAPAARSTKLPDRGKEAVSAAGDSSGAPIEIDDDDEARRRVDGAIGRVHRMGQQRDVTIHRLVLRDSVGRIADHLWRGGRRRRRRRGAAPAPAAGDDAKPDVKANAVIDLAGSGSVRSDNGSTRQDEAPLGVRRDRPPPATRSGGRGRGPKRADERAEAVRAEFQRKRARGRRDAGQEAVEAECPATGECRRAEPAPAPAAATYDYAPGDAIEARWNGGTHWHAGTIVAVNPPKTKSRDPTFGVHYDAAATRASAPPRRAAPKAARAAAGEAASAPKTKTRATRAA